MGALGAEVIKVEAPTGDSARGLMRIIGAMVGLKGRNYYFEHCNRNRRHSGLGYMIPAQYETINMPALLRVRKSGGRSVPLL